MEKLLILVLTFGDGSYIHTLSTNCKELSDRAIGAVTVDFDQYIRTNLAHKFTPIEDESNPGVTLRQEMEIEGAVRQTLQYKIVA